MYSYVNDMIKPPFKAFDRHIYVMMKPLFKTSNRDNIYIYVMMKPPFKTSNGHYVMKYI